MNIAVKRRVSQEEYLQGELQSETKHELIDDELHAISGASKVHDRIAMNISSKLLVMLQDSPCEPFSGDIKVKVSNNFFYTDVVVACDDQIGHPCYIESQAILAEVLSKPTRRTDETVKHTVYQSISTLQEYLLIEQDFLDVEVCCRSEGWLPQHYFLDDDFTLDSIGVSVSVEEIYRRVQNEDVLTYQQQQVVEDAG